MNKIPTFPRVIVPVIHGSDSNAALNLACACSIKENILLIGIVRVNTLETISSAVIPARRLRAQLRDLGIEFNLTRRPLVIVSDQPWQELISIIYERQPALVIFECPDHLDALSIDVEEVIQKFPYDLALAYGPIDCRPRDVMVSLRGGPHAELALKLALAIKSVSGSNVMSLHIKQKDQIHSVEAAYEGLSKVLDHLPEVEEKIIETNEPVTAIIKNSRSSDIVILGSTAQPRMHQPAVGKITQQILNEIKHGVVVVKSSQHIPGDMKNVAVGRKAISILVDKWFAENTYHSNEFTDLEQLCELKERQGLSISLALPALNEEKTVGRVIQTIQSNLIDNIPLLDEMVLIDSNSDDQTRQIANSLGIPVYIHQEILKQYGMRVGKGEALWKSLYVTRGDIILWIDTDITNIHPRFVYGLIGPLLTNPNVKFVKGFYRRPLRVGDKVQAGGGGRVTELTARPLLNLFYPQLSGFIQPLSGEYGGRRSALEQLPFFSGYGVEIGLLIDFAEIFGLKAVAQVDLKERIHHNQPLEALSKMSFAIIQAVTRKLESRFELNLLEEINKSIKFIHYTSGRYSIDVEEIAEGERPPMIEISEYQKKIAHKKETLFK